MATCQKCGAHLNGGERFCPVCGAPVVSYMPTAINPTQPMSASEFEQYLINTMQNNYSDYQGSFMNGTPIDFAINSNRVGVPLFFGFPYDPMEAGDIWDPMNPQSAAGVLHERYRAISRGKKEEEQEKKQVPTPPVYDPMSWYQTGADGSNPMTAYMASMSEYMKSMYASAMESMAPYYAANAVQNGVNAIANANSAEANAEADAESVAESEALTKKEAKAAKKAEKAAEREAKAEARAQAKFDKLDAKDAKKAQKKLEKKQAKAAKKAAKAAEHQAEPEYEQVEVEYEQPARAEEQEVKDLKRKHKKVYAFD